MLVKKERAQTAEFVLKGFFGPAPKTRPYSVWIILFLVGFLTISFTAPSFWLSELIVFLFSSVCFNPIWCSAVELTPSLHLHTEISTLNFKSDEILIRYTWGFDVSEAEYCSARHYMFYWSIQCSTQAEWERKCGGKRKKNKKKKKKMTLNVEGWKTRRMRQDGCSSPVPKLLGLMKHRRSIQQVQKKNEPHMQLNISSVSWSWP